MRRSIIQPLLLAALAAGAFWALAIASPAGAAPDSPNIICAQQRPMIIPCCPVPVGAPASQPHSQPPCCATCCTTTTCCPQPAASGACCVSATCGPLLTISSSPNPSKAGQKVVISGTARSRAQVTLWRKLAKQSSFHQISQTAADGSGAYTFTEKPGTVMADQEWYVTSNGAQSATDTQSVAAVVALASSTGSTRVGRTVALSGHVTPSHAGERVLIEMSRGGAWHVIARARLSRGSSYVVSHHFARSGAARFRVVLKGDRRNRRSVSRAVKVSVHK